jgi:hypothetical protein
VGKQKEDTIVEGTPFASHQQSKLTQTDGKRILHILSNLATSKIWPKKFHRTSVEKREGWVPDLTSRCVEWPSLTWKVQYAPILQDSQTHCLSNQTCRMDVFRILILTNEHVTLIVVSS